MQKILFLLSLLPQLCFATPLHLDALRNLQEQVPAENSRYIHGSPTIEWEKKTICHANCSSLVTSLFKHCYGWDEAVIRNWFGRPRPKAITYYQAIAEERGFTRIEQIENVLPGDIIATNYNPDPQDLEANTGHLMVVNALPKRLHPSPPLLPESAQWEVEIIDSTRTLHGKRDSRKHDGLGIGYLRLYTNLEGKILGYTWSILKCSKLYLEEERPLLIGRLSHTLQHERVIDALERGN